METVTIMYDKPHTRPLPRLVIQNMQESHPLFWERVKRQTGLEFKPCYTGMDAQPETSDQILKLLMVVSGLKIHYVDTGFWKNVLLIKMDRGVGFKIDSICYDCATHNNLQMLNLKPGDRLSC